MAISFQLSLTDDVSGPAAKAAAGLARLERGLKTLRAEEERQARLQKAVGAQLGDKTVGSSSKLMGETKGMVAFGRAADKAAQAQHKLNAEIGKMPSPKKGLGGQINGAFGALGKIGGDLGFGTSVASVAQAGWATAAGAAAAAAYGTYEFGSMVADAQKFKADTMFAFEQILHSKQAAQSAFDLATKSAMATGSDFREWVSGFNTLLAQGFDTQFADQLMKAMADLKTLNPQANMEGITRAISQIKTTGRLQGDELMQLAEAGLNVEKVYDEIAKSMHVVAKDGKSANQVVQDLQSQGKISSDTAIKAIMASLKGQVGGKEFGATAMAKADKTMQGTVARALVLKEAFLSSINIDWSPIQRAIEKVMAVLQSPAGERFAKRIGKGFDTLLSTLDGIKEKDIEGFLDATGRVFEKLTTTVASLASSLRQMKDDYDAVNSALQNTFGFDALDAAIWAVSATIDLVVATVKSTVIGSFTSIGMDMVSGIIAGIDGGAAGIVDSLVGAVENAANAAEDFLLIGSPSKLLREMGNFTAQGFALGIDDQAPTVEKSAVRMSTAPYVAGQRYAQSTTNNSSSTRSVQVGSIVVNNPDHSKGVEEALRTASYAL